jgi:hypothetical protein
MVEPLAAVVRFSVHEHRTNALRPLEALSLGV